jgi:hypothetical protein
MALHDAMAEHALLMFWLLMGAAVFVLLIACAKVANLTLMRGIGREREMQMRAASGAGRGRLRRLLLAENLMLALFGGAFGVFVALAGLRMLVAFAAQSSPRASEIRIDGVVLAFVPRIGTGHSLAESLAPAGRQATLGRGRQRVRRSLVVVQIALSMVLLAGAGLLVRTLGKNCSRSTAASTRRTWCRSTCRSAAICSSRSWINRRILRAMRAFGIVSRRFPAWRWRRSPAVRRSATR